MNHAENFRTTREQIVHTVPPVMDPAGSSTGNSNPGTVYVPPYIPPYVPPAAPCWVARAVYGEENPRWLVFRDWLMVGAPRWFRRLYVSHGERFARWIGPHPGIKSVIRRWMDFVIADRVKPTDEAEK
jgi:hypothetical protein